MLYSFKAGKDGAYPYASLIDFKGELYGTDYQGGAPNWGTLFKVGTSGKESVLHAFPGAQAVAPMAPPVRYT